MQYKANYLIVGEAGNEQMILCSAVTDSALNPSRSTIQEERDRQHEIRVRQRHPRKEFSSRFLTGGSHFLPRKPT